MRGPPMHLDPRIDTIIEIGGQDAKFTTMRDGMVTFSHMNTVCAAGTGSFIEEQAERLGCESRRLRAAGCAARAHRFPATAAPCSWSGTSTISSRRASPPRRYSPRRSSVCGRTTCRRWRAARRSASTSLSRAQRRATGARGGVPPGPGQADPRVALLPPHRGAGRGTSAGRAGRSVTSRFVGLPGLARRHPRAHGDLRPLREPLQAADRHVGGETVAYGFLCGRDYEVGALRQDATARASIAERRGERRSKRHPPSVARWGRARDRHPRRTRAVRPVSRLEGILRVGSVSGRSRPKGYNAGDREGAREIQGASSAPPLRPSRPRALAQRQG